MKKELSFGVILRCFKLLMLMTCIVLTIGLMLIAIFGSGTVFDTYENIVVDVSPAYFMLVTVEAIELALKLFITK